MNYLRLAQRLRTRGVRVQPLVRFNFHISDFVEVFRSRMHHAFKHSKITEKKGKGKEKSPPTTGVGAKYFYRKLLIFATQIFETRSTPPAAALRVTET